jgi:hypothetical protein
MEECIVVHHLVLLASKLVTFDLLLLKHMVLNPMKTRHRLADLAVAYMGPAVQALQTKVEGAMVDSAEHPHSDWHSNHLKGATRDNSEFQLRT